MLSRYCHDSADDVTELTEDEELLVNKFHVPVQWLHEAKVFTGFEITKIF